MKHGSGKTVQFWKAGRVLKCTPTASGHRVAVLVDQDGTHTRIGVHRLVLLTFVGPAPAERPFGLHKDDDPNNNRLTNLYWGDRPANSHDSVRNGNHVQARKTACPLGHALVGPNLVPSTSKQGYRGCLACKKTQASHYADTRLRAQGRERTTYYRTKDGFQRRAGESFQEEADRRYTLLMNGYRL